jgi:sec-independent protein translocase protein TatA
VHEKIIYILIYIYMGGGSMAIDSITGIIIVAAIVVALFGYKKLPDFVRNLGRATGEFQKGKMEAQKELDEIKKSVAEPVSDVKNTVAEIKKG